MVLCAVSCALAECPALELVLDPPLARYAGVSTSLTIRSDLRSVCRLPRPGGA
jgi:hypothetical protein